MAQHLYVTPSVPLDDPKAIIRTGIVYNDNPDGYTLRQILP
jgi:hypothetical protein